MKMSITTRMRNPLVALARVAAEFVLFAVTLWLLLCALQHVPFAWTVTLLAGVWFALGAVQLPWLRHAGSIGLAAFLVPLGILGWLFWVFGSMPMKATLDELPGAMLSVRNLGIAALLCCGAVAGRVLATRLRARMRRRTTGCS